MAIQEVINSAEGQCKQHRADHSFRVMYLARKIFSAELERAPEEIRQKPDVFVEVLDWAAVLHDREMTTGEQYDFTHGKKAAERVDDIIGAAVDSDGKELIKFLCIFHVPDDSEITGLNEIQSWLLRVFKDADALDRVRFDNSYTLGENYLRFEIAKTLIPKARELWERTRQGFDLPKAAFDAVFGNRVE